jgi:hypothetical protein
LVALAVVFAACGAPRDLEAPPPVERAALTRPAPEPTATPRRPPPQITRSADGRRRLEPGIGPVATLRRQPDGSYRQVCGEPSDEVRAVLENDRRRRRGAR